MGSLVLWKLQPLIEKKRFSSSLERFESRLIAMRFLAVNTQSDWEGVLRREGKGYVFAMRCLGVTKTRSMPNLALQAVELKWNGKIVHELHFLFLASGEVRVEKEMEGNLRFSKKDLKAEWDFPRLFKMDGCLDGKRVGPVHPHDL
ncbi:MAG: hypothetical protein HY069_04845 [Chlamydiia bacterium]|nr:hypothetical protein [Chlamydiia bacterium]